MKPLPPTGWRMVQESDQADPGMPSNTRRLSVPAVRREGPDADVTPYGGRGQSVSPTVNIVGQLLLLAVLLGGGRNSSSTGSGGSISRCWPRSRPCDTANRDARPARPDDGTANPKMFEPPAIGVAHFLIFWGFLILTLALLQVLADGLIHGLRLPIVSSRFTPP